MSFQYFLEWHIVDMENEKLMKILKAVANDNRFMILRQLRREKELSVGDLAETTGQPFRSVSRDLSVLRRVNLVQVKNNYAKRVYSIDVPNFPKDLLNFLDI